jgi:hypothetical protein
MMPENYEIALFLHIVGVFGVAGAATSFLLVMAWMRRAANVQTLRPLSTLAVWTDRLFPVAAVLVLAAGVFMVEDADIGWGTGWVNTSLIALVVMGAGGGILMTPRVGAIHKAVEAAPDGPITDDIRTTINDPILWGTLHAFTLGLFGIIWNMTTKPGDAQAGTVILLAFVIGAASVIPMTRRSA